MEEAFLKPLIVEQNNATTSKVEAIEIEVPPADSSSNDKLQSKTVHQQTTADSSAVNNDPKIYDVKEYVNVTPPIVSSNLREAFKFLPIHGRPKSKANLKKFNLNRLKEFVGCGLNDDEFDELAQSCSPSHLKTGDELVMNSNYPSHIPLNSTRDDLTRTDGAGDSLCIVKKVKMRCEKDSKNLFIRSLKYRGVRMLPPPSDDVNNSVDIKSQPLEPGVDLLYRIRLYRTFEHSVKERQNTRHSLFINDIVLLGRQTLVQLRDRIACANDASIRTDMSNDPDAIQTSTAKDMFPSGFLFINNVFYVDERAGCHDISAPIRAWAAQRNLGHFTRRNLNVRLDEVRVRLGHPDVYMHQGTCEHMFVFSEIRLLSATDPLSETDYPLHTAVAQNQTLYCTTCAEFGARWFITGCTQIPFDPAFFCDTCLRMYLYCDGVKVCEFKAYQFRGNEINILKPQI